MKQYVKLFIGFSQSVDAQINEFLNKHLNYTINKITFDGSSSDRVLVVFNVKEPQKDRLEDKSNEELKKIRGSMACGFEAAERIDKILASRNYV